MPSKRSWKRKNALGKEKRRGPEIRIIGEMKYFISPTFPFYWKVAKVGKMNTSPLEAIKKMYP